MVWFQEIFKEINYDKSLRVKSDAVFFIYYIASLIMEQMNTISVKKGKIDITIKMGNSFDTNNDISYRGARLQNSLLDLSKRATDLISFKKSI